MIKPRKLAPMLCAVFILTSACAAKPAPVAEPSPTIAVAAADTPAPSVLIADIETPAPTESAEPSIVNLTLTEAEYPRVDGSTATMPLGEAMAAVLLGKDRADCAAYAAFSGTAGAWENLAYGRADLLLAYGAAKETEALLERRGAGYQQAAIGADALVFLVNAANPVDGLTVEQARGIYAGEITNWQEVGGNDAPIMAYQRNATAGSQAMMDALVMGGQPMMPAPADFTIETMSGLAAKVANYDDGENAIGYNVLYYVSHMRNEPRVKLLKINGAEPTAANVESGAYPLASDFYAVIRAYEPAGSPAGRIFRWLQSEEGRGLLAREGYAAGSGAK